MNHTIAPVEKRLDVPIDAGAAYELFTTGIASWWPLDSHSVGGDSAANVVFEATAGGRIYEITDDGTEHDWGDVIDAEAGVRLVFSWFPGRDRSVAGTVEVSFTPQAGGCRIGLVHSGWELLGENAMQARAGYDTGWDYVLLERFGGASVM